MTSPSEAADMVKLEKRGKIAIISLNRPKQLNAMNEDLYYRIATLLHHIATDPNIYITVLTGTGSGADVAISLPTPQDEDRRRSILRGFVANTLHITHAFYTHPKILVCAMNGPAVGLSAAIIAFSDFIYAAPHSYLLTPFSSLGLVTEGNASVAFVERLGIAKANEALIMSKRLTSDELLQAGFVNKIIDVGSPVAKDFSDKFLAEVLKELDERLSDHLNSDSLIKIKALIRGPRRATLDQQGVLEVMAGMERILTGVPQEEFRKITSGEKRHKL